MDTMLDNTLRKLNERGVSFDVSNKRVWCLAYVINLTAKKCLENLKASGPEDETCPFH